MNRIQKFFTQIKGLLSPSLFFKVLIVTSYFGLFMAYGLMFSNVKPERSSGETFKPAEQTITINRLWKMTYKTEQEEEISKQVADVYSLKKEYAQK